MVYTIKIGLYVLGMFSMGCRWKASMSTFNQIRDNTKRILSTLELMKLDYAVEEQEGRIHRMEIMMMNIEWKC